MASNSSMDQLVESCKTKIKIKFIDGRDFDVPVSDPNQAGVDNYCTSIKIKEQMYNVDAQNIIGKMTSYTLSMTLISNDGLLIPSNTSSIYYEQIHSAVVIEVNCIVNGDTLNPVFMGRYYVDSWESGQTAANSNEVTISATNVFSKVKNLTLDKLQVRRNITPRQYLMSVIENVEYMVDSPIQVGYDSNIGYDIFENENCIDVTNVDHSTLESILNNIAQSTLTNLWFDRNGYLHSDFLHNDGDAEDPDPSDIYIIDGSVNTFSYGITNQALVDASGVKVSYIDSVNYEDKLIKTLDNYNLTYGNNSISNIEIPADTYTITCIRITCESGDAYVVAPYTVYKNNLSLNINASETTSAKIEIYGTSVKKNYAYKTRYKDDYVRSDLIEIKNEILKKDYIDTYIGYLNYTSVYLKNPVVYAEGLLNPALELGDWVEMRGSKLNIWSSYKIIGLEFTLGTNYRCKATLLKTVVGADSGV